MVKSGIRKKGRKPGKKPGESNSADVAMHFIDAVYNLLNTGNIVGVFLLGLIALIGSIMWRLPDEQLGPIVIGFGGFLYGERFYLLVMAVALIYCIHLKRKMDTLYKDEIQRLTDVRKDLIHGLQSGALTPLQKHTSTGYDVTDESNSAE